MFVAFGSKTSKSIVRTFAGNWRAQVSALLIILIIGGTYFSPFGAESATFTFTQNNWSGGVTANVPNHTSNRAGWTEYSAQSGLTVGTDVKLQVANYTFTDDGTTIPQNIASGGGFGNGTNASTMVVGSGAGASVSLSGVTTPVNTWDTVLKAVPGALSVDSTMIRNASDDTIYVTQGNGVGFYQYTISTNTWTVLANAPGALSRGSTMIRNGSDDTIYVTRGNNTTSFYQYTISTNTWTVLANAPGVLFYGSNMIRNGSDDTIYVTAGGDSTSFYKYTISTNTWTTLANTSLIGEGSQMIWNSSEDSIYVTQGWNGSGFRKYSITTNTWTSLANSPSYVNSGSTMIRNGSDDTIYVTHGEGTTIFYKYTISTNTWTTLTNAPGALSNGSTMIRNGSDDTIYVTQGNRSTGFYKYTISTNVWTTLAITPGTLSYGSNMIRNGSDDTIYVTQGNGVGFYQYTISTNTWTVLANTPGALFSGSNMIRNGSDDTIYVTQGNSTTSFYKYTISTNTWTVLANAPGALSSGASMIRNGADNEIYVTQGNNATSFYQFIIQSTVYDSAGTFTSASIDIGSGAPAFGNLSWTETLNFQSSPMLKIRSSATADFSGAPAWNTCTAVANGALLSSGGCITVSHQYIQYQASLTTGNTSKSPTLDSLTFGYSQYGSGELTSSIYNAESFANLISKMSWTATNTSATETVKFQVRSASTEGGIASASWCGYADCLGTSYFDASSNGTTLIAGHPLMTGADDQYFQYKVFLNSGGVITPILTGVSVQYVVNAQPEFDTAFDTNGISVSQISNPSDPDWGKTRIIYRVRDVDTTTGTNTPNNITPSFSYDNGAGFVTIGSGSLSASATTNKSVNEVTYTEYEAIWDAKTDLPGIYNASLQVKVSVNDNEAANNIATATDTTLFDSKAPTLGAHPILVDASLVPASVTLSATDDSAIEMKVGLAPDLSDATYETYNAGKLLTLATNPDTVYVQYRDSYNNETNISSVTSTETPSLMIIQDVSNASTSVWRLFISWKTVADPPYGFDHYELYRSTDNITFSPLTSIASRATNYYIDETTAYNTLYYYKIKMIDTVGNTSWFSAILQGKADGLQNSGEGGGGTDVTPPIVTSVLSSAVSTTQATITWNTDELSTSTVGYSVNSGLFTDEMGIATYADNAGGTGIHQVTLTGLTPATTYYYQVKSADPLNNLATDNNGGGGYTFTTNPGPAISGVALSSAANTQATILWNTDIDATTFISYSTDVSGGALVAPIEVGTSDMVKTHSHTIIGLTTGTQYYFSVKSVDVDGNIATDNNGGIFYTFTTTTDTTPPVISTLSASVITFDRVAITWLTDEQSTSQIKYATHSGGPYTATTATTTYGQDHFVIISSLVADTTYYFKAYSTDLSGNEVISPENSFKTQQDPTFQHAPLSNITGISASLVTDTNAVITMTTDQPAMCSIEYGTAPGNYTATPVTEALENKKHSITLTSLLYLTTYYYQATCIDNLNTSIVAPEGSFTTLAKQVASGSEGGDIIAPVISSVSVSAVTGENATVTWTTDEFANGYVSYGITADYGGMEGDYIVNKTITTYATDHTVLLKNLVPSTKYYFVVLSSDARGNLTTSSESSFTTTSPSTISSLNIVSTKIGEATLAWKTSTAMSSIVEYGLAETYGDKQESTTQTKEHSITVNKLQGNQLYHFRVKGKDQNNNLFSSSDYTFSPRSLPTISDISSKVISDTEVEVSFDTNVPTDANISFINMKDAKDTGTQGKPDLALSHVVTLKNLQPGASYGGKIIASDEAGNKVTQDVKNFTTSQDTTPPQIDQLKTDMALAQDGKVQAIVSWYTDEPATTSITYKEGTGGEERTIKTEGDLSTSHVVVLTAFKIGSVYFVKATSMDKSGNESISKERMIITPQQTENVVQMIISNFNDMFGWAKR